MAEDKEAFLDVDIAVRPVGSDYLSGKVAVCGFGKAIGEFVGFCLAFRRVNAPTFGVVPFAVAGSSVAVYGDYDDVVLSVNDGLFIGTEASVMK